MFLCCFVKGVDVDLVLMQTKKIKNLTHCLLRSVKTIQPIIIYAFWPKTVLAS